MPVQFLVLIVCIFMIIVGVCIIVFARRLAENAHDFLNDKTFGQTFFLWCYRIAGIYCIIFSIFVLYQIFFR
jgi:hypothetical protein